MDAASAREINSKERSLMQAVRGDACIKVFSPFAAVRLRRIFDLRDLLGGGIPFALQRESGRANDASLNARSGFVVSGGEHGGPFTSTPCRTRKRGRIEPSPRALSFVCLDDKAGIPLQRKIHADCQDEDAQAPCALIDDDLLDVDGVT